MLHICATRKEVSAKKSFFHRQYVEKLGPGRLPTEKCFEVRPSKTLENALLQSEM